jgi:hypothetical protein
LRKIDGKSYADLEVFGEALGLSWTEDEEALQVSAGEARSPAIKAGQPAPSFTLPDMRTGKPVSTDFFRGRKAVFFMWASW